MRTPMIVGMIAGIILVIIGLSVMVNAPSSYIFNPEKYIQGDAYNFQIEASIKGGQIAGAMTAGSIYLTGGLILFFGSFIMLGVLRRKEETERAVIKAVFGLEDKLTPSLQQVKIELESLKTKDAIREPPSTPLPSAPERDDSFS